MIITGKKILNTVLIIGILINIAVTVYNTIATCQAWNGITEQIEQMTQYSEAE